MSNLKIAKQLPIDILLKRILKKVFPPNKIEYSKQDIRKLTSNYKIISLLNINDLDGFMDQDIICRFVKHEFNLLGSGWLVRNSENDLELNELHKSFAAEICCDISKDYQFINWQLDIRSGFEFDITKQSNALVIDQSMNVDIKNCWELGRLQHLPQMALAAKVSDNKNDLIEEFKNQVLDFVASNPIGMGVQWSCTMDVGIRVSNMLLAFDLFNQIDNGNMLDGRFTSIFIDSIHRHADFIFNHLEYKEGAAGNHYLFNLVGLLFASNYLTDREESLNWKKFAEHEIEREFYKQFFKDGGNFEGSTTYHCLSAEAMLYATALMLRGGKKMDQNYVRLLSNVRNFISNLLKPDGTIPQFGDNDSGRLFKFTYQENLLNYRNLVDGFSGLTDHNNSALESKIVEKLSRMNKMNLSKSFATIETIITQPKLQLQNTEKTKINFPSNIDLGSIDLFCYPDFGVYVFKSEQFYLCISAISNKKMHHSWGHVHNDKLSFDLQVFGNDLVMDPGTYSYSAFPSKRNEYRSSKAHSGILIDGVDQNETIGLFYLDREIKCEILVVEDLSITLKASYYGVEHIREFVILSNQLIITDCCNKPFLVNINKFEEYAPNYGVMQKSI